MKASCRSTLFRIVVAIAGKSSVLITVLVDSAVLLTLDALTITNINVVIYSIQLIYLG